MSESAPRTLHLTPAAHIRSAKSRFLWDPYIPLGTVTIFAGRGGEGKSSFALHIAAQTQAGTLAGDLAGQPRSVLIIGHEDDWGRVVKPRLVGAGARLESVYKVSIGTTVDRQTLETVPAFPLDIGRIRQAIEETNAALVIVDPITATLDGDLHKVVDVRRGLDPLIRVAQECNCAVIAIMHFNKGAGSIGDKVSGSHAFRDASRSLLVFATDEDTGHRVVTLEKSSYSAAAGTSFAFDLATAVVDTDDGDSTEVPEVRYLGESDVSVGELVNRADDEQSEAAGWLRHKLEDEHGTASAADLKAAAGKDGISWDAVKRASRRMVDKHKEGFQGRWVWTLDDLKGAKSAKSAKEGTPGEEVLSSQSEQRPTGTAPFAPIAPFGPQAAPFGTERPEPAAPFADDEEPLDAGQAWLYRV